MELDLIQQRQSVHYEFGATPTGTAHLTYFLYRIFTWPYHLQLPTHIGCLLPARTCYAPHLAGTPNIEGGTHAIQSPSRPVKCCQTLTKNTVVCNRFWARDPSPDHMHPRCPFPAALITLQP
ncbi:hypothetical protein Pyn_31458 [Prunus yedoensis var. nudiflora]|uniref:Uncharacterized protein n=1 Tax=Prunus yedoensis var. nudiflora TaxID=2094558 RepID=A0A314ZSW1_PRUYE|nr:hypothetical protein Pyn_31458 [Prunus yedoensis var. nudiflora]